MRGRFSVKSMPPHLCAVDFRPNQCLRINARSFFSRVRGSASVRKYETDLRGGFAVVRSRPAVLQCLSHRCKVLPQLCIGLRTIAKSCRTIARRFCNGAGRRCRIAMPPRTLNPCTHRTTAGLLGDVAELT